MPGRRATERWLFTCEHGGRSVPAAYANQFSGAEQTLNSHRGWDAGALQVFDALAPTLGDAAFPATVSRLLVDLNRSLRHPGLFSEFTRPLPRATRQAIISDWWRPWRESVADQVRQWRDAGQPVRHFSVHTFAPVLGEEIRNADIGLLYDPSHAVERDFCVALRALLAARGWRVRLNYPYRGAADGHTTALRRVFGVGYTGIELEFNQALFPRLTATLNADVLDALDQLR